MDFKKIYKRGLGFSFLLLIFIIGVLFIPNLNKKQVFDENSIFTSAPEDNYEPNNDFTTAYDLTSQENVWLSSINGNGSQGDDDYFMILVDYESLYLKINLIFFHILGDINLALYDNAWFMIAESNSTTDNEYIDLPNPIDGTYFLKVSGQDLNNSYDLLWQTEDYYEENDDYWSSSWIDPNYYYSNLKIVGSDDDWFRTYLNPGDTIDITIYFDYMVNDLDLELYDPVDSINPRVKSYSVDNDEIISFTADISGDWRFKINRTSEDSVVRYDLDLWLNTGGPGDDYMEENDDYWGANWVDPNYYSGLKLVYGDEDWFRTYLNPGDIIDISIYFNYMEGNLQLELWDPSETNRVGSYSGNNDEFISFTADMSGDWRIRVFHAFGDSEVWYDLDIWLNAGGPGDDFYEINDEPHMLHKGHPSDLMEYEQTWLSDLYGLAVQGNNDWYIIDVTPGFQQLIIELKFNHSLGNIGLDIYEEGGSWITGNNSDTDDEYIDFWLPHPGMYAIMVYGNNWGNEYDMWWDDFKTDIRSDDNYEINNYPSSAYDISFAQNKSLWEINGLALQFNEDWYEIYVDGSNLELIVWLAYDSAEGLMGFEVYDEDLNKITGNFTLTDNDYIVHAVHNGTHYIRIFGDNSGNVYNLLWRTQELEEIGMIPGYDLLILIASIIGVSMVGIKIKRSKFKHK